MKKMTKKTLSVLIALTFVIAMVFTSINVFAANTVGKELVVKKILTEAAKGVNTPNENFVFTATPHSFNDQTTPEALAKLPALADKTADYTAADATDADANAPGKQVIKASADFLDGVTFTEAGQYTYTIKETAGTTADMVYSKAEYLVSLFVGKAADGNFVVNQIQVKQVKDDAGNAKDDTKTEYNPDLNSNKLAFGNTYNKTGGNPNPGENTDPNDPDNPNDDDKKGLVVNKIVADADDAGLSYGFSLTLTAPEGISTEVAPTAFIVAKDGTKTAVTMSAYGEATTFSLKAGEKLVLDKVLLGSTAKLEETDAQGYQTSVNAIGIDGAVTNVDDLKNTGIVIGEPTGDAAASNHIAVTNTKQTATGILLKNLPFIVLGLVATAGIVFYVVNRAKKAENN
ncbi:MAG: FctA domain-containing protein [Clostridia bacterium]|nr:FctA domain-containing protein [Clostridia bacterium]